MNFVGDAPLIIHNATFDMTFLNAELGWAGRPLLPNTQAVDTLDLARRRYPGAQNSLDALCRRFGIDNSSRQKHGALLDSELLAEVYLELMGGRQPGLVLHGPQNSQASQRSTAVGAAERRALQLPSLIDDHEAAAHGEFVADLGDSAIWRRYQA